MVKAIIDIDEAANRVLNIIKAKFGLNDKSQAIELMAEQYQELILEPELRPEFIKQAKQRIKQKPIDVGSINNLKKRLKRK